MSIVKHLLKGLTLIDENQFPTIVKYYKTLNEDRRMMQYNNCLLWYLSAPYYMTEYKDCLLIIKKKKFIGNDIWILEMPPIHKDGDKDTELAVLLECKEDAGLNCRMTEFEIPYYGIGQKSMKKVDTAKGDFIYGEDNLSISGKGSNAQLRTQLNKWNRNEDLTHEFVSSKDYTQTIKGECLKVIEYWDSHKKEEGKDQKGYSFHLKVYVNNFNLAHEGWVMLVRFKGELIGFSIAEHLGNGNISVPDRKLVISKRVEGLHQAFRIVNYLEIQFWTEFLRNKGIQDKLYFNFGSAGGHPALYEAKVRMKPIHILQNYKFKEVNVPKEIEPLLASKTGSIAKQRGSLF